MLGFELLVTLYTNFSPKVKHFCKIFGDSFLKCNFAWNSNLKSKIQNFEIYVSCIGLYKEKNPEIIRKGQNSDVKKKQHFFYRQNMRKIKHTKCAIHL